MSEQDELLFAVIRKAVEVGLLPAQTGAVQYVENLNKIRALIAVVQAARTPGPEVAAMGDTIERLSREIRDMKQAGTAYSKERDTMNGLVLANEELKRQAARTPGPATGLDAVVARIGDACIEFDRDDPAGELLDRMREILDDAEIDEPEPKTGPATAKMVERLGEYPQSPDFAGVSIVSVFMTGPEAAAILAEHGAARSIQPA